MKLIGVFLLIFATSVIAETRTYNGDVIPLSGEEAWSIGATTYNIEGCMIVPMLISKSPRKVEFLFAVKAEFSQKPNESHAPIARDIAKYAKDNGYFDKAKLSLKRMGIPNPLNEVVGVALIKKQSILIGERASGYRYQFPVNEL
jgi:hypothetical protein